MWKDLLSGGDISHKRLIALLSFIVLVAMVVLNAFGILINETLIYVFFGLCSGNSAISVLEKFFTKK